MIIQRQKQQKQVQEEKGRKLLYSFSSCRVKAPHRADIPRNVNTKTIQSPGHIFISFVRAGLKNARLDY
ncbi:hypothetical protein K0M31_003595 [Melipona bicolor]|uniref:Uncharacterized protein n=1 Tax=Melipona bicolor TaxID=60889 RepID=A0AA40KPP5_9HYME|nr:hypothetical protein K0M31_003595 [Melipona bicolor]